MAPDAPVSASAGGARARVSARLATLLPERLTWVVGIGTTLGLANTASASWIVAALIGEGRLDVERASFVVTAELAAMAMTMIALGPYVRRLPLRTAIVMGLVAIVATQAGSLAVNGFWPLMLVRALSGMTFGLLYTIAIANGSASPDPQRTFAGASAVALLIGTAFNPLLGYGSAHWSYAGVLGGLTAYCMLLALPAFFIQPPRLAKALPDAADPDRPPIDRPAAVGVVLLMALLTVAYHGSMLFAVYVAEQTGLRGAELGGGLAGVSLLSAGGGVAASLIGTRAGRFAPLAGGLVALGVTLALFPLAASQAQFWAGITLAVALFWFLSPYVFGLAVDVDPTGRLATAAGSVKVFFSAVGAGAAGMIAARFNVAAVGLWSLALCAAAIPLGYLMTRYAGRAPARR